MTSVSEQFGMAEALKALGINDKNLGTAIGSQWVESTGDWIESISPVDGQVIAKVQMADSDTYEQVVAAAQEAFKSWRKLPAPQRGEVIRQVGEKLREYKEPLGKLVSYEMGKSYQEGLGEVQEMIDICDFAVGLSRQLYGLTMHSERASHRMYEQYHPLGLVGII
ncbi:MAG: aldehyde dehydrogenase family protein, partial [Bacteroidota bacterium]